MLHNTKKFYFCRRYQKTCENSAQFMLFCYQFMLKFVHFQALNFIHLPLMEKDDALADAKDPLEPPPPVLGL